MKSQLATLTGVRFLLAFYVLFFHNVGNFEGYQTLSVFLLDGYSAVSAFFLLSGLIMAYNYDSFSSLNKVYYFYIARIARIYPLYFLSLIIDLPLFIYFIYKTNPINWQFKSLSIFFANLFMIQTWNKDWLDVLNSPGWSLSVELFFYLLFPFISNLFNKMSFKQLVFVFFISYLVICLEIPLKFVSYLYYLLGVSVNPNAHPLTHLPTFLCGMIFGKLITSTNFSPFFKNHYFLSNFLTILPLILIFWFSQIKLSTIYNINNGLYIPLYASFFLGALNKGNAFYYILSSPLLIVLGHISYGVYLLQIPVRKWLGIFYEKGGFVFYFDKYIFFIFYLITLFLLCYVLYIKVEIKAQQKIKHFLANLVQGSINKISND